MSLGVDQYLTWAPAQMAAGADWLVLKSDLVEESARSISEAGERGTEGQCGQFITQRREDAAEAARRVRELGDMMRKAGGVGRQAGAELDTLVTSLREADSEMRDRGFVRVEGEHVRDTRTTYEDAAERNARETEAEGFRVRIWGLLREIRAVDDKANHDLHNIVGREVRDRTAAGNGDLREVGGELFAIRGDHVTVPAALGSTAMEILQAVQDREPMATGVSYGWWNAARGGGPVMTMLGFVGGVANAPDDEPLLETLVAEGAGTVGGTLGSAFGFAVGGGPTLQGFLGHFLGGIAVSQSASSYVRGAFDRAN